MKLNSTNFKNNSVVFILFALILLALVVPVLFGSKIFLEGDSVGYFYSYFSYYYHHPGVNWNVNFLFGFPMATTFQYGFFNPLNRLIFTLFDFVIGYHLLVIFYVYSALILTYLFTRSLKISKEGSMLAAIAFALGQSSFWWIDNMAVVSSLWVLPAIFLVINKLFEGKTKYLFLLTPIIWLSWLGAHPQWNIYSLIAGGAYALFIAQTKYRSGIYFKEVVKPLFLLALSVGLGVVLAFPQFLYSFKFASLSYRSAGVNYTTAISDLAALPLDLIRYILPAFRLKYVNSEEFVAYVGFFPLFFGVLSSIKLWRKNKDVLFFCTTIIFCIIAAMKYSPLSWVISKLPLLNYFRGLSRLMTVGSFAMAILAGFGLDYALKNQSEWRERGLRWLKMFCVGFVPLVLLTNLAYFLFGNQLASYIKKWFDANLYSKTTHLPLGYYHSIIDSLLKQSFGNLGLWKLDFVIPFASMVVSYFVIKHFLKNEKLFIILVLVLSSASLLFSGYLRFNMGNADLLHNPPELVRAIRARESNNESFRVFSFLIGFSGSQITTINDSQSSDLFEYLIDGLTVNTNLLWDVPSIDGFDTLAPLKGQELLAYVGSESSQVREGALSSMQIPLDEKLKLFSSRLPLLSMLNVKYIISAFPLPSTSGLVPIREVSSTRFHVPIYLYENTKVLPRWYFANGVSFLPSNDDLKNFERITSLSNDFRKTTYIECQYQCSSNFVSKKDNFIVNKYEAGLLSFTAHVEKGRWFIFSESDVPGWHATIDNQLAKIYSTNYIFQGVYIPAGEHEVKIEYTSDLNEF